MGHYNNYMMITVTIYGILFNLTRPESVPLANNDTRSGKRADSAITGMKANVDSFPTMIKDVALASRAVFILGISNIFESSILCLLYRT